MMYFLLYLNINSNKTYNLIISLAYRHIMLMINAIIYVRI